MTDRVDGTPPPGRRKDGRPFKHGNTREDGSYSIGKARTPEHTRFAEDDGRPRGRRPKGTRNLATEWKEELSERITVTENGRKKKITKLRGVVKTTVANALKGKERSAEIALRYATEQETGGNQLRLCDLEIIKRWIAQRSDGSPDGSITDDADEPDADQ